MDFLDLALVVGTIAVGVALLVFLQERRASRSNAPRCQSCGAALASDDPTCAICDDAMNKPARSPGGEPPRPTTVTVQRTLTTDAKGGLLNAGVRPWMIKGALGVMFLGIGVRVLGMLEPAGLNVPVPMSVMAALTVLGGIAAFVGFVVLDVA